jgi:hypothetical protein
MILIKLLMMLMSYLFAGLLFTAIARDNGKSIGFCIGLTILWPLYVWFYAFYYGARFVVCAFQQK